MDAVDDALQRGAEEEREQAPDRPETRTETNVHTTHTRRSSPRPRPRREDLCEAHEDGFRLVNPEGRALIMEGN